jgi:hypothetical protein
MEIRSDAGFEPFDERVFRGDTVLRISFEKALSMRSLSDQLFQIIGYETNNQAKQSDNANEPKS